MNEHYSLIVAIVVLTLFTTVVFDLREARNEKSLFYDIVNNADGYFAKEGGLTLDFEIYLLGILDLNGFDTSRVSITGTPGHENYGNSIYYTVTYISETNIAGANYNNTYKKTVHTTSEYIPLN